MTLSAHIDNIVLLAARSQFNSTDPLAKQALGYLPNKTAAGVVAIIHLVVSLLILFRLVKNRDFWALVLPIGIVLSAVGYVFRILLARSPNSLGLYIAQYLTIALPPGGYLAFNYITYGRFITICAEPSDSLIRATIVGKLFVCSDILTFLVQAFGGSLMGNQKKPDQVKKGKNIFMLGVIFQVVSYGFFVLLVWTAHRRINSRTKTKSAHWKPYLRALYFSSFFIIIRCLYRIAEGRASKDSSFMTHEVFFYLLDPTPLLLAVGIYIIWWPGTYIVPGGGHHIPIHPMGDYSSSQNLVV